ncbi:MAG: copper transporter [Actinomycetota bacterium]
MINLRYHIVSIVAVFLALGIGIAMGTSFIDGVIVERLESSLEELEGQRDDDAEEIARLNEALARDDADDDTFVLAATGSVFSQRLDEVPVMVITADGVDDEAVAFVRRGLAASGARFTGVVTISEQLDLTDPEAVVPVANVLRVEPEPDVVRAELSRRLGLTFLPEAPPPVPVSVGARLGAVAGAVFADPASPGLAAPADELGPDDDLLPVLVAAGLVDYDPAGVVSPDLNRLPRVGTRFLVVGGPEVDPGAADVLRLVVLELLRSDPPPVVVASTVGPTEEAPFLDSFRGDGSFAGTVPTVDGLGTIEGVVAAILALDGIGELGPADYGRRDDATSLLPVR